jgi:hypothetical protein
VEIMEPHEVTEIENVLEVLQPVERNWRVVKDTPATDVVVVGEQLLAVVHLLEEVVLGQQRFAFGRAEVRPHQSIAFSRGIPRLAELVAVESPLRFARLVGAVSLGVEGPTVVAAADAALVDASVEE